MVNKSLRLRDYLEQIHAACGRIARYTSALNADSVAVDELYQDAVIRNLEIIGEACRNIQRDCSGFVAAHPELPLSAAYQVRNAAAHGYLRSTCRWCGPLRNWNRQSYSDRWLSC